MNTLIQKLKEQKIAVSLKGDQLDIKAPKGAMTAEILKELKEHKEELVALLSKESTTKYEAIPRAVEQEYYPLSSAQLRMWVLCQNPEASKAYHMPLSVEIDDACDPELFAQALQYVVKKHEILRTVFVKNSEGEIGQKVLKEIHGYFSFVRQKNAEEILSEDRFVPFDLEHGPLFRAILIERAPKSFVFSVNMHHIISDGWSVKILAQEILKYYRLLTSGTDIHTDDLGIQYKDYSVWQQLQIQSGAFDSSRKYWLSHLAGELPVLQLPTHKIRPSVKTFNGETLSFQFDAKSSAEIRKQYTGHGGTLFMWCLSVFSGLTHRYVQQEQLVIGTPVAGRERVELEEQIGLYVNTLALKVSCNPESTFEDLFHHVKEVTTHAYENQSYPFDQLVDDLKVKRNLSRSPVFDVMLTVQNAAEKSEVKSDVATGKVISLGSTISKFDMQWTFIENQHGIQLNLDYNTDVYSSEAMKRLILHFKKFSESILSNPTELLREVNFWGEQDLKWQGETRDYHTNQSLIDLYYNQLSENSDQDLLVFQKNRYSGKEVEEISNRLAHFFKEKYDIEKGDLVTVKLNRSEWIPLSILTILKMGGVYVPLDPSYPLDRIEYIEQNCQSKFTVDANLLEEFQNSFHSYSSAPVDTLIDPTDLAYIIYTSGSTGNPKGCMLAHEGVINRLQWMWDDYQMNTSDIILHKTTFTFDVSVWELFLPLCYGCRMVICEDENIYNPLAILELIEKQQITRMHFVPSMLSAFIQNLEMLNLDFGRLSTLKSVFSSGEALHATTVQKWYQYTEIPLVNLYGPTEASVDVTQYTTSARDEVIPIGKPVANVEIRILDRYMNECPVGVLGEIHLGGVQLSKGYLNNQVLTNEKFIQYKGERLYKTGDLGFGMEDGNLYYSGRTDHQVKIRGYRIELGEIEARLTSLEEVDEAAVIIYSKHSSDKMLVGFVTSSKELDESKIKKQLKSRLPEYAVPDRVLQLKEMPLTPNGKLDRKHLTSIPIEVQTNYIAPESDMEIEIAFFWKEILNLDQVGVEDDFYELGGHSIKAIRLQAFYFQKYGVRVDFESLLNVTTILGHIKLVESSGHKTFESIPLAEHKTGYRLSSAQQRLWILNQLGMGGNYNIAHLVELPGIQSREVLEQAILSVMDRHEILRTIFVQNEAGISEQRILNTEDLGFKLEYSDYRSQENAEAQVLGNVEKEREVAFNLSEGPLFKAHLYVLSDTRSVLYYNVHHIIFDGWSEHVLTQDILAFYDQYKNGKEVKMQPLSIQYKDYAEWQQNRLASGAYAEDQKFWTELLSGELPVLNLPSDFPRPAIQQFEGKAKGMLISRTLVDKLKAYGKQYGGSLYVGLLTSITSLFYRYTGQKDLIIGSPVAGREHPDLAHQLGFYVNTLALRLQISESATFESYFSTVKKMVQGAYKHMNYPFDELIKDVSVEQDPGRSPLFDVMVALQNNLDGLSAGSSEVVTGEIHDYGNRQVKFDLNIDFQEVKEGLVMIVEYKTGLYRDERIERFMHHYEQLLSTLLDAPESQIGYCDYFSAEERQILNDLGNVKGLVQEREAEDIVAVFQHQVKIHGEKIAIRDGERDMSYEELNTSSNLFAKYLMEEHLIKAGDRVGVYLDKGVDLLVAMLGILKVGGSFVPLSLDYPEDRIAFIQSDSGMKLLVQYETMEQFRERTSLASIQDISFSAQSEAYIMYTSGSTGQPKGVVIARSALSQKMEEEKVLLSDVKEIHSVTATNIIFDVSILELLLPLTSGGSVTIVRNELLASPDLFLKILRENNVNVLQGTPSFMSYLLSGLKEKPYQTDLKYICVGGESLKANVVEGLKNSFPGTKVNNHYGPTETTIDAIVKVDVSDFKKDLIGKPIGKTTVCILDEQKQQVPVGVYGEIYIGGPSVALEYLNQPDLTEKHFVELTQEQKTSRLYRTGDLGRWDESGEIEFLGRNDDQVKVRGYRIELGEIEQVLQENEKVEDVRVFVENDQIIACVIGNKDLDASILRNYLSTRIPPFMIPEKYVMVQQFPLTVNGKIDIKAIDALEGLTTGQGYVAPENDWEMQMVSIWEMVLSKSPVGVLDNFYDLGGNSLKLIRLHQEICKHFNIEFGIVDLFNYFTIKELVHHLIIANKLDTLDEDKSEEVEVLNF